MKYLAFNLTLTFTCIVMINTCSTPRIPKVFGHRGAMGHITENTLPSIAKAIDLGVDGVEIDVFKCASGELVVFHDHTLDKLTNSSGYIEQLDLDSIQKIEVLGGHTIPTLNEVLDLIDARVILNIELKGTQTAIPTHELLQVYFDNGKWQPNRILISSFNWKELELFYEINQEVPLAVLTEDDPLDALFTALSIKAQAINPYFKTLNTSNIKKMKKAGFKIYTWTVNNPKDAQKMLSFEVDGIISDFPERIKTFN